MNWYGFAPYVPVAQRRQQGMRKALKRMKKGETLQGINIKSRKIATTFWGESWCDNLEKYSDYANRLPRGRTYARNGSIVDLRITKGKITAMVCGSSLYDITITIDPLAPTKWKSICLECSTSIRSIMDLMRGKLGNDVIRRMTDPQTGMFPSDKEIKLRCSCPDGAYLCKHLAATLYGVGHRLDTAPELLFLLRGVDQNELISHAITSDNATSAMGLDGNQDADFVSEDLATIFGIELAETSETPTTAATKRSRNEKLAKKKPVRKKPAKSKTAKQKPATKKANKKNAVKKKAVKRKTVKKTVKKKAARKRVQRNTIAPAPAAQKAAKKKAAKKNAKSSTKKIVIRFG